MDDFTSSCIVYYSNVCSNIDICNQCTAAYTMNQYSCSYEVWPTCYMHYLRVWYEKALRCVFNIIFMEVVSWEMTKPCTIGCEFFTSFQIVEPSCVVYPEPVHVFRLCVCCIILYEFSLKCCQFFFVCGAFFVSQSASSRIKVAVMTTEDWAWRVVTTHFMSVSN